MKPTKKTRKREPFTHEVRTKVTQRIGDRVEEEAASKGLRVADIVRLALTERYPATAPSK